MELRVNLKVCEGCGCLWYRAQVDTRVYCSVCQERFKDFPTAQHRKRRGRPRKTILTTVFAVEASAEVRNLEWEWPTGQSEPATAARSGVQGLPLALLASSPAHLPAAAALLGGAQ